MGTTGVQCQGFIVRLSQPLPFPSQTLEERGSMGSVSFQLLPSSWGMRERRWRTEATCEPLLPLCLLSNSSSWNLAQNENSQGRRFSPYFGDSVLAALRPHLPIPPLGPKSHVFTNLGFIHSFIHSTIY